MADNTKGPVQWERDKDGDYVSVSDIGRYYVTREDTRLFAVSFEGVELGEYNHLQTARRIAREDYEWRKQEPSE